MVGIDKMADYNELQMWAAAVAQRLGKGKEKQRPGGGWLTCCPAHEDNDPSLEIFVDEGIRLKCYAGCDTESIRLGILAAGFREIPQIKRTRSGGGITVNRIAHDAGPSDTWFMERFERLPDKIYEYRNERGQLQFIVIRINAELPDIPKKIVRAVCSARPKDGSGSPFWIAQAYPTTWTRPLYNLPELINRPNDPVLVVEGEKAADAARRLLPQYVVVTWAGGTGTTRLTNWGPLQNRNVVLWPDNDDPGIKAMAEITQLIGKGKKAAKSVKQIFTETDDNFPKGFDLGDAYEDSYTPLDYLLGNAPETDLSKLPDTAGPADAEEIAERLAENLDKYAVLILGPKAYFVDLSNWSAHLSQTIPYAYHDRSTLMLLEPDAYVLPGGKKKRLFIEDYLESNKKRILHGMVYDPSTMERFITYGDRTRLNLYCGFVCPPQECAEAAYRPFIDHIYASCKTKAEADYILQWVAAKLQKPELMLGTMLILSGREGCGKTLVCEIVRKILGPHNSVQIGQTDLTGVHNTQYGNKLFIDVEEYNIGQSKNLREYREKIKNLVTARTIIINPKGIAAYENPCYHNIIATTNAKEPEDISFDNRRMTFIRFDNPNLKTSGAMILDKEYFAPLIAMLDNPVTLSGLFHYLMNLTVDFAKIMKRMDTELTEEAMTFVSDPVSNFLRAIADSGTLPSIENIPDNTNPFPISQWPESAVVLPRGTLYEMLSEYNVREQISQSKATRAFIRVLMRAKVVVDTKGYKETVYQYPRGIPADFDIDRDRRWKMINRNRSDVLFEDKDRSICLPNIYELRQILDELAGKPIDWSIYKPSRPESDDKVVDFPGKREAEDEPQF
jgi:hypothetical protein